MNGYLMAQASAYDYVATLVSLAIVAWALTRKRGR